MPTAVGRFSSLQAVYKDDSVAFKDLWLRELGPDGMPTSGAEAK